ncbi:hypothetical protein ACLOJK_008011 [Asimina triloba]
MESTKVSCDRRLWGRWISLSSDICGVTSSSGRFHWFDHRLCGSSFPGLMRKTQSSMGFATIDESSSVPERIQIWLVKNSQEETYEVGVEEEDNWTFLLPFESFAESRRYLPIRHEEDAALTMAGVINGDFERILTGGRI